MSRLACIGGIAMLSVPALADDTVRMWFVDSNEDRLKYSTLDGPVVAIGEIGQVGFPLVDIVTELSVLDGGPRQFVGIDKSFDWFIQIDSETGSGNYLSPVSIEGFTGFNDSVVVPSESLALVALGLNDQWAGSVWSINLLDGTADLYFPTPNGTFGLAYAEDSVFGTPAFYMTPGLSIASVEDPSNIVPLDNGGFYSDYIEIDPHTGEMYGFDYSTSTFYSVDVLTGHETFIITNWGVLTPFVFTFDALSDACGPADANADGVIDPLDAGFVQSRLGCTYPGDGELCLQADVNADGVVDPLDVGFVLSRFGSCE